MQKKPTDDDDAPYSYVTNITYHDRAVGTKIDVYAPVKTGTMRDLIAFGVSDKILQQISKDYKAHENYVRPEEKF